MTGETRASIGRGSPDRFCDCGREIDDDFRFCPTCGFAVRPSGKQGQRTGELCRTLCRCAERTYERLAESHLAGMALGEESFTDYNLQDIRQAHPDRVIIRQYNRREESRNGADWEWWFHDGTHGFGMRVQAKKAHKDGRYVLRHIVRGTGALQSTQLIEDAAASGCLPFYVFYNHKSWTATDDRLAPRDCDHTQADQRQMGCTIVSALVVQRVMAEGMPRSSDHVKRHSLPWNRFVCDSYRRRADVTSLETAFDHMGALHSAGRHDLRLAAQRPPVRADTAGQTEEGEGRVRRSVTSDLTVPYEDVPERPRRDALDTELHQTEAVDSALYRALDVLADSPPPLLPERIRSVLLHGELPEPPDERVAGVAVVALTDR